MPGCRFEPVTTEEEQGVTTFGQRLREGVDGRSNLSKIQIHQRNNLKNKMERWYQIDKNINSQYVTTRNSQSLQTTATPATQTYKQQSKIELKKIPHDDNIVI